MLLAHERIEDTAGDAFNVGGGPARTVSLIELMELIAELRGERPVFNTEPWRPADQRYRVSCTARFERLTGWRPKVNVRQGVERLCAWLTGSGVARPAASAVGQVAS